MPYLLLMRTYFGVSFQSHHTGDAWMDGGRDENGRCHLSTLVAPFQTMNSLQIRNPSPLTQP